MASTDADALLTSERRLADRCRAGGTWHALLLLPLLLPL